MMENMDKETPVKQNTKSVSISYTDPNATDSSSSSNGDGTLKPSPKKITRKIALQMHLHRENDDSVSVPNQLTPSPPSLTVKMNNQKLPGVRVTKSGRFGASVKWKKQYIWLGTFNTSEEAWAAILLKKGELNRDIDLTMKPPRSRRFGPSRTGNSGKNREIDLMMEPRSVTFAAGPSRTENNGKKHKIELTTKRRSRRFDRFSRTVNNSWGRLIGNPELAGGAAEAGVESESSSKLVEQEIGGEELLAPKKKAPLWLSILLGTPRKGKASRKKSDLRRDRRTGKFVSGPTKVVDIESDEESGFGSKVVDIVSDEESGFGILSGVRVMDKNGFLLGEFGKIDDLSICWDDDVICLD